MIIRFFKFTKSLQLFVAIVLSFCIFLNFTIDEFSLSHFYSFSSFIIIFFLSIFIISKNALLKNNQFTTFGLVVFSSIFFKSELDFSSVLSYLLLLLSVRKIYSLNSKKNINKKLIDIGFWFSSSVIVQPVNTIYIISIIFGVYIFYKLDFLTFFKMLVGFLSSVLLAWIVQNIVVEEIILSKFLYNQVDLISSSFYYCIVCLNFFTTEIIFTFIVIILFIYYLYKNFGTNLVARLKNLYLLIFFINSIALIYFIETYLIFIFFPFLITLIKIIAEQYRNWIFELVILIFILINLYPF